MFALTMVVASGFMLTIASCVLICYGQNLNASFVFGDSLVDAGNNNYIISLSKADYLPNGIDFLPSRQPTGRYTNGRTIVDILGKDKASEFEHIFPSSCLR